MQRLSESGRARGETGVPLILGIAGRTNLNPALAESLRPSGPALRSFLLRAGHSL